MKIYLLTFISSMGILLCAPQTAIKNDTIILQKIIFHSSGCFGSCPKVDLEIDSNRNINVSRQFYKGKGQKVDHLSGNYKGVLSAEDYSKLLELLKSCKIDSLKFPAEYCCDGRLITVIVYYDNKRKYLKSMWPPETSYKLIAFLTKIGTDYPLSKANEPIKIEE